MILFADSKGPDCADAQADLSFRCPFMPKDTFSRPTYIPIHDNISHLNRLNNLIW